MSKFQHLKTDIHAFFKDLNLPENVAFIQQ